MRDEEGKDEGEEFRGHRGGRSRVANNPHPQASVVFSKMT